jgi:hypothetical protein
MKASPIQNVNTCAYCVNKIHIIDPRAYPNDFLATKDKRGWKCGNCIEKEIADRIAARRKEAYYNHE